MLHIICGSKYLGVLRNVLFSQNCPCGMHTMTMKEALMITQEINSEDGQLPLSNNLQVMQLFVGEKQISAIIDFVGDLNYLWISSF